MSSPPPKRIKLEEAEDVVNVEQEIPDNDDDDEERCSICLQSVVDRTVVPICSHEFCFDCLLVWTAQSRRCPLCSQAIGAFLIHNIRSRYDYQKHFLAPLPTSPRRQPLPLPALPTGQPRRRPRNDWGRRERTAAVEADRFDRALAKRRWVYANGLYAKHVASNAYTRYRPYPTPAQFAASPELIARTTTFLRRELQVWVNLDVEFLTTFTLSIMKALDIRSEGALKLLAEFLDLDSDSHTHHADGGSKAEHFAHEVYTFVRSPYKDLFVYDEVVQYDQPPGVPAPFSTQLDPSTSNYIARRWAPQRDRDGARSGSRSRSRSARRDSGPDARRGVSRDSRSASPPARQRRHWAERERDARSPDSPPRERLRHQHRHRYPNEQRSRTRDRGASASACDCRRRHSRSRSKSRSFSRQRDDGYRGMRRDRRSGSRGRGRVEMEAHGESTPPPPTRAGEKDSALEVGMNPVDVDPEAEANGGSPKGREKEKAKGKRRVLSPSISSPSLVPLPPELSSSHEPQSGPARQRLQQLEQKDRDSPPSGPPPQRPPRRRTLFESVRTHLNLPPAVEGGNLRFGNGQEAIRRVDAKNPKPLQEKEGEEAEGEEQREQRDRPPALLARLSSPGAGVGAGGKNEHQRTSQSASAARLAATPVPNSNQSTTLNPPSRPRERGMELQSVADRNDAPSSTKTNGDKGIQKLPLLRRLEEARAAAAVTSAATSAPSSSPSSSGERKRKEMLLLHRLEEARAAAASAPTTSSSTTPAAESGPNNAAQDKHALLRRRLEEARREAGAPDGSRSGGVQTGGGHPSVGRGVGGEQVEGKVDLDAEMQLRRLAQVRVRLAAEKRRRAGASA